VVVGTSRKRFLGELAGGRPPGKRLPGTLASNVVAAILGGADVVRVHDVAEGREALAVAGAAARAPEGGSLWDPPRPPRPWRRRPALARCGFPPRRRKDGPRASPRRRCSGARPGADPPRGKPPGRRCRARPESEGPGRFLGRAGAALPLVGALE